MNYLFAFPEQKPLAASLAGYTLVDWEWRHFPDGESYVRVLSDVSGKRVTLLCSLNNPDSKILPLLFLAHTLKEMGATEVGLIAPYLGYMRQDKAFHPGECVTSKPFAALLSHSVDWLVTIDPHLHRYHALSEIYTIPARAFHAAELVATWIRHSVKQPLLIGPDEESRQWVSAIAETIGCPFVVLTKIRHGDKDVEVSLPDSGGLHGFQPVLVDDIISTARTMIETVGHLRRLQLPPPVCIGIHAVFAEGAYDALKASGIKKIVTCNTILHETNELDISALLHLQPVKKS